MQSRLLSEAPHIDVALRLRVALGAIAVLALSPFAVSVAGLSNLLALLPTRALLRGRLKVSKGRFKPDGWAVARTRKAQLSTHAHPRPAAMEEPAAELEKTRESWEAFADEFDLWEKDLQSLAVSILPYLNLESAQPSGLLEAGCGYASAVPYARSLLPQNARHVAVDFSPKMLAIAKERVRTQAGLGEDRVKICLGDVQNLSEFPDASFSRYFSSMVVQEVPTPPAMLREAFRVLEPGGVAGLITWGRVQPPDPACAAFGIVPKLLSEAGVSEELVEMSSKEFKLGRAPEALRNLLQEIGFRQVQYWFTPCRMQASTGQDVWDKVSWQVPTEVSDAVREQVKKTVIEEMDHRLSSGQAQCFDCLCILAYK
eukprot:gnl/TRDRNA2_/TRDRNA2_156382_c0_seq4.p1 gnl/TRDRNA2_/TRDRNA2_156382_c0~~gnl/TRDRNA2_/TRDRNA2_156382_c0_seq4.p1  ORF type:complete len:371 (-),score=67.21 gnl/TRDRNA2_/TRDRNA2_156382_c0_seq4:17-1129(-)